VFDDFVNSKWRLLGMRLSVTPLALRALKATPLPALLSVPSTALAAPPALAAAPAVGPLPLDEMLALPWLRLVPLLLMLRMLLLSDLVLAVDGLLLTAEAEDALRATAADEVAGLLGGRVPRLVPLAGSVYFATPVSPLPLLSVLVFAVDGLLLTAEVTDALRITAADEVAGLGGGRAPRMVPLPGPVYFETLASSLELVLLLPSPAESTPARCTLPDVAVTCLCF